MRLQVAVVARCEQRLPTSGLHPELQALREHRSNRLRSLPGLRLLLLVLLLVVLLRLQWFFANLLHIGL